MNTIRLGSTGPDVKKWQGIVKVTADGVFGPATEGATKTWQRSHMLAADGVVGPATWSMAGVSVPAPSGKTTAAPTDLWAYEVAKRAAPNMPEAQRQYVLAVARGEGFYGNGWDNPSAEATSFGLTGKEGIGSNNWGAVQGSASAGSFPHIDHHADGSAYVGQFKKYKTPEEGFMSIANTILGGGPVRAAAIQAAIAKGNLKDAVYAQHDNKYFELAPDKYLAAVIKNYNTLTTNVEWKKLLGPDGVTGLTAKVVGALGVVAVLILGIMKVRHG